MCAFLAIFAYLPRCSVCCSHRLDSHESPWRIDPASAAFLVFAERAIPIELYGGTPCNAVLLSANCEKR